MFPASPNAAVTGKPAPASHRGFTLIEIAVVLVIVGFLLAMLIGAASTLIGQQRRDATRTRLANMEAALAVFVSQNKRLPCPALGTLASDNAAAGNENFALGPPRTCVGNQVNGVVPWRAIGISEQDATDGWGNRFTYRVAPFLMQDNGMDFTPCDPGGVALVDGVTGMCQTAGCNSATTCTPPAAATATKGLQIRNIAGTVVMDPGLPVSTGAAYVVISHGENAAGSYNNAGVLQLANGPASGTEEALNRANLALAAYYVDDFQVYPAGAGHFDDFVLRPTILSVAEKARLGPRVHF